MALNPMMTMKQMQMPDDEDEPVDMSDPTDTDKQSMLDELDDAANAGDDFEAKASFEDVPGTDSPISEANEMPEEDPEKLKMLLAQMGK